MIVHIFSDTMFSDLFISKCYLFKNTNEHHFIVFGDCIEKKEYNMQNVFFIQKKHIKMQLIKEEFKCADKILIHSMSKPFFFILWLSLQKNYILKSIPIFWGGDLYEFESYLKKQRGISKLINLIRFQCLKKIYRNVINIGFILPNDYYYFKNHYVSKAKYHPVCYTMDLFDKNFQINLSHMKIKMENPKLINICIGHSANKTLRHKETIKNLISFKNVILNLPLAYGDKQYIKCIKEYIKKNEYNINIYTELINFNDYAEICNQFDIIIINSQRQIALANLFLFLLLEKYICLPKNSINYDFFTNELDIDVIAYEDLCAQKDYLNLSVFQIDKKKNKRIISEYVSQDNFITVWENLMQV